MRFQLPCAACHQTNKQKKKLQT
uniref:Cytochrome c domain-containing protein n=1 Tax=Anguilla anguilla TaxID=7936 RepID=A0A0E9WEI5_ANGAN